MSEDVFNNQVSERNRNNSNQQRSGESPTTLAVTPDTPQVESNINQAQNQNQQSKEVQIDSSRPKNAQPYVERQEGTDQQSVHQEVYSEQQPQQKATQGSKQGLMMKIGIVSMVVSIIIATVYLLI